MASVEALGFRMTDVKLILNSHAHFDHAGGIAQLQRASGATVASSPPSASVLQKGSPAASDPQYQDLVGFPFPQPRNVRLISDGETLRAGTFAVTAHFTPGHSSGGTSWSCTSCEGNRCLDVVHADSLTPVSEKAFLFSRNWPLRDRAAPLSRQFLVGKNSGVRARTRGSGLRLSELERTRGSGLRLSDVGDSRNSGARSFIDGELVEYLGQVFDRERRNAANCVTRRLIVHFTTGFLIHAQSTLRLVAPSSIPRLY